MGWMKGPIVPNCKCGLFGEIWNFGLGCRKDMAPLDAKLLSKGMPEHLLNVGIGMNFISATS